MKRQKLLMSLSRYCRIFMITFLLLTALLFIQGFIGDIIWDYYIDNSYYQPQELQEGYDERLQQINSSTKLFLPDGTVHLVYKDSRSQYSISPSDRKHRIYDTNNNLVWQGNYEEFEKYSEKYLDWIPFIDTYDYNIHNLDSVDTNARNSIILPILKGSRKAGYWRNNKYGGYFTGFDSKNNTIGYCGSNGFVQKKSQTKSLGKPVFIRAWVSENSGDILMLWWTKHDIFQIDFKKQTVKTLLHLPGKEIASVGFNRSFIQIIEGGTSSINDSYDPLFICRTKDDYLFFISHNSNETNQIKLPEEIRTKTLHYNATNEKLYIKIVDNGLNPPEEVQKDYIANHEWLKQRRSEEKNCSEQLYEVDSSGSMKLIKKFEWIKPPQKRTDDSLDYPDRKTTKILSIASPVFYDISKMYFAKLIGNSLYDNYLFPTLYEIIMVPLYYFSPYYNTVCYFLSLLMAGVVFFHAWPRRKSMASLLAWVIFAFLFNIVGLLVYLALNFTPTIKCHSCNKRRGLITPQCPHCGAELSVAVPGRLSIITEA